MLPQSFHCWSILRNLMHLMVCFVKYHKIPHNITEQKWIYCPFQMTYRTYERYMTVVHIWSKVRMKGSENLKKRRIKLSMSLEDAFEKDKREDCDHSTERWLHQMRHENRTCATEKDRKVRISEISEKWSEIRQENMTATTKILIGLYVPTEKRMRRLTSNCWTHFRRTQSEF